PSSSSPVSTQPPMSESKHAPASGGCASGDCSEEVSGASITASIPLSGTASVPPSGASDGTETSRLPTASGGAASTTLATSGMLEISLRTSLATSPADVSGMLDTSLLVASAVSGASVVVDTSDDETSSTASMSGVETSRVLDASAAVASCVLASRLEDASPL